MDDSQIHSSEPRVKVETINEDTTKIDHSSSGNENHGQDGVTKNNKESDELNFEDSIIKTES